MYALYLWTYVSSVLAHAVFLDLRASAAWGALAMGPVAVPLAVSLWRAHPSQRVPASEESRPVTP
jgi:putative membrane protein